MLSLGLTQLRGATQSLKRLFITVRILVISRAPVYQPGNIIVINRLQEFLFLSIPVRLILPAFILLELCPYLISALR